MVSFSWLIFFSIVLSFCSLIYELNLAQVLSATLGGTILRYCTTIGVYIFSLGVGALIYERVQHRYEPIKALVAAELALSLMGALAPFFILLCDPTLNPGFSAFVLELLSYLPSVLIGVTSGFELPILLKLAKNSRQETRLLAADYLGMFLACLAFPLLLLPHLGVFGSSFLAAHLNGLVLLIIIYVFKIQKSYSIRILIFGWCCLLATLALYSPTVNRWAGEIISFKIGAG